MAEVYRDNLPSTLSPPVGLALGVVSSVDLLRSTQMVKTAIQYSVGRLALVGNGFTPALGERWA